MLREGRTGITDKPAVNDRITGKNSIACKMLITIYIMRIIIIRIMQDYPGYNPGCDTMSNHMNEKIPASKEYLHFAARICSSIFNLVWLPLLLLRFISINLATFQVAIRMVCGFFSALNLLGK